MRNRLPEISIDEIQLVLEYKPEIKQAVELIRELQLHKVASGGVLAYCIWLFNQINENKSLEMFNRLADGVGLPKKSPILVLRDRLMKGKRDKTYWNNMEIFSFVVRTWNAFSRNRAMSVLRLTTKSKNGSKIIELPKIAGWK